MKVTDFQVKATIGHGHFGYVQVVKHKETDSVYAMKVLQKSDILSQIEVRNFKVGLKLWLNFYLRFKLCYAFLIHSANFSF